MQQLVSLQGMRRIHEPCQMQAALQAQGPAHEKRSRFESRPETGMRPIHHAAEFREPTSGTLVAQEQEVEQLRTQIRRQGQDQYKAFVE